MLQILFVLGLLIYLFKRLRRSNQIIIFHPFCNAGGGGERVLWTAVTALQKYKPGIKIVIAAEDVNFNDREIVLNANVHCVFPYSLM